MINRVILVGRITKDPELLFAKGNIPYVKFTLAVNRKFVNNEGKREADFIFCIVWNKQAENLAKYVIKGVLLGIEGTIRTSSYENSTGQKQFSTQINCDSVQFLEFKKDNSKTNNMIFNDFNQINEQEELTSEKQEDDYNIEEDDGLPF